MRPKAEEFRRRADNSEREANRMADPDARRGLKEVARQWREMADQVEGPGLHARE